MTAVTDWLAANACSQPGMVWVGTNTELVNASGNTPMYAAAWTASGVRTTSPSAAITHDQAYPNSRRRRAAGQAGEACLPPEPDGEPHG